MPLSAVTENVSHFIIWELDTEVILTTGHIVSLRQGGLHDRSLTIATVTLGIAIAWEALFVYDATVFALTLFKACRSLSTDSILRSRSILTVIFRDGEWRAHLDDIVYKSHRPIVQQAQSILGEKGPI